MSENSKIEWTDATWNPVRGCSKVSEGCRNCYAMSIAARFSGSGLPYEGLAERRNGQAQWTNRILLVEGSLNLPLTWKAPRRIFVNSTSDLFHEDVPQEFIYRVSLIMLKAGQHSYQVLTKRPKRMAEIWLTSLHCEWLREALGDHLLTDANLRHALRNVWMGTSVETQAAADTRIPHLLRVPARVRFLSCEPLLAAVDLGKLTGRVRLSPVECNWYPGTYQPRMVQETWLHLLSWIICGGESGPGARPMHPDWARALRDQCQAAGVPFFFKQHGNWLPLALADEASQYPKAPLHEFEDGTWSVNIGKRAAGRLLDGREWDGMPGSALSAEQGGAEQIGGIA